MNNRNDTQNETYNNNKQANKNIKLCRHWAQGDTTIKFVVKL